MEYFLTLYRMRYDGSDVQKVLDYIYDFNLPYISDGWIYYTHRLSDWAIEQEELDGMEECLYRIRTDGTDKAKLLDEIPFSQIVKKGDWLVYYTGDVYRMKTDGTEKVRISSDSAPVIIPKDDWIYFTTFDDEIRLYRIDWEGKNRQKLSELTSVQTIAILDDWIYFTTSGGEDPPVYLIKTDGTEEQMIELGDRQQIIQQSVINHVIRTG